MKIGLVLDDTLDTPDGVQQYVLRVGEWLETQGHDVHYLVGNTTRSDIPNIHSLSRNLRVKFNGNSMSMPLPTSKRKLRAFLAEQQFDVLHVQAPYSPFMAGRLLQVVPSTTAVIGTFHILPYSRVVTLANKLLGILNRRTGKRFDQMLAVSAPAQKFARDIYGYKAKVVPNCIDVMRFTVKPGDSPSVNIVFLGRLVPRKGVLHLLRAAAYIREHNLSKQDFRVIIGGKGELHDELQRYAAQHSLTDIVTLSGFVAEEYKPIFLSQADIVAYPSTAGESFGYVVVEAMAAARGVVLVGNNPGYASVMQPYPDQMFEPTDTAAFAKKLARYLDHPLNRARANEAQRQYVKRFDITVVGGKLVQIYEQALQSRRRS